MREPGDGSYVAPHPVRPPLAWFHYDMKASGGAVIRVFQAGGDPAALVRARHDQPGKQRTPLTVSAFAPGVYFYRIDIEYDSGSRTSLPLSRFIVRAGR